MVDDDPVSYSPVDRQFTVDSDNTDLINTQGELKLVATLTTYPPGPENPDVTTKEPFGPLVFGNPCDTPDTFEAVTQDATTPDNYSGDPIETTFKQHTIDPAFCQITYSCKAVTPKTDAINQKVPTCEDLSLNLNFAALQDGKISFTATADDYINSKYTPGTF